VLPLSSLGMTAPCTPHAPLNEAPFVGGCAHHYVGWHPWMGGAPYIKAIPSNLSLTSPWLIVQDGDTPLHRAAYWGHTAAMDLLIKSGVKDLEAKNKVSTPLISTIPSLHSLPSPRSIQCTTWVEGSAQPPQSVGPCSWWRAVGASHPAIPHLLAP
jgi:hypothetical protein